MTEITWKLILLLEPPSRVAAAARAFCTVRRPDNVATVFEVDVVEVDQTRELENNEVRIQGVARSHRPRALVFLVL